MMIGEEEMVREEFVEEGLLDLDPSKYVCLCFICYPVATSC